MNKQYKTIPHYINPLSQCIIPNLTDSQCINDTATLVADCDSIEDSGQGEYDTLDEWVEDRIEQSYTWGES